MKLNMGLSYRDDVLQSRMTTLAFLVYDMEVVSISLTFSTHGKIFRR